MGQQALYFPSGHLLAVQQPKLHPEHHGQPLVVVHHPLLPEIPSGFSRIEAGPVSHHAVQRHPGLHHRREGRQGVPAHQSQPAEGDVF